MTPQMVVLLLVVGACSATYINRSPFIGGFNNGFYDNPYYYRSAGLGGVGIGRLGMGGVGFGAIGGSTGWAVGGRGPLGGSFIAGRRFPSYFPKGNIGMY